MRKPKHISTRVVLDIATGAVVERECYEYSGPLAECISAGGSGGKSKSKNQSQNTSQSESGVKYNEDFMRQALGFAGLAGKQTITTEPKFDAKRYLSENPDVAGWGGMKNYSSPEEGARAHYEQLGKSEGRKFPGDPGGTSEVNIPTYNPQYVAGKYTDVAPGGFDRLENSLYGGQQSKLAQAYQQSVGQQREELAQSGGLNSPSQFLEGSARSSLDRTYMNNLQQAARDAFQSRLGLETSEAARRTGFDTGEATRQTGFNEQTASQLLDLWMKKIGLAIEAGRYSKGESQGTSYGTTSSIQGSGQASYGKVAGN